MSSLKPSPMRVAGRLSADQSLGNRQSRGRRVSWGNYRVREYLRTDAVEEESPSDSSTFLAPQDSYEGPLGTTEETGQDAPLVPPKSPSIQRDPDLPDQLMMVTPMRTLQSPKSRPRTSLIDPRKLTPMKSFGFSLRNLARGLPPVMKTPIKLMQSDEKYLHEARKQRQELENRLFTLRRDKENVGKLLKSMENQAQNYRDQLKIKSGELNSRLIQVQEVSLDDVRVMHLAIEQQHMANTWERAYSTPGESVWHHSSTFYNSDYFSLFHMRMRVGQQVEVVVSGEWPDKDQLPVFKLLWERKHRLFQARISTLSNFDQMFSLADDIICDVILFMKDYWKVSCIFKVEDARFTDVEMTTVVRLGREEVTVKTDIESLRSTLGEDCGKMSDLLTFMTW